MEVPRILKQGEFSAINRWLATGMRPDDQDNFCPVCGALKDGMHCPHGCRLYDGLRCLDIEYAELCK